MYHFKKALHAAISSANCKKKIIKKENGGAGGDEKLIIKFM